MHSVVKWISPVQNVMEKRSLSTKWRPSGLFGVKPRLARGNWLRKYWRGTEGGTNFVNYFLDGWVWIAALRPVGPIKQREKGKKGTFFSFENFFEYVWVWSSGYSTRKRVGTGDPGAHRGSFGEKRKKITNKWIIEHGDVLFAWFYCALTWVWLFSSFVL